ncbi:MAG: Z1 domain-containing protein [Nitrospiria bacterium]
MSMFETALGMCQISLSKEREINKQPLTRDQISSHVDQILALPMFKGSLDREKLIKDLEELFTVWSNDPSSLGNDIDHQPWLSLKRAEIDWRFWKRYELFLLQRQRLSPAAIQNIEKVSEEVLSRIEDPVRDGPWDRRGLVMGNVQSGKTATYNGLICKAADAGYKVIVVLAGLHNNLRSQTQIRLDEGFLGYKAAPIGSEESTFELTGVSDFGTNCKADSVTNRNEKGDFSKKIAKQFGIQPGGNPLLFVVKKNDTVLKNLVGWIHFTADSTDPQTGRRFHRNVPLLVIDDEADQASVDTRTMAIAENGMPDSEHDPTKINGLIRRLLFAFEKSAYVGFTATPFANIFIHERARTNELGDDLFPRSFIVNLPAPSNYIGASRIFGIQEDPDVGLEEVQPIPIIRLVNDHAISNEPDETEGWMPPKLVETTRHIPLYENERCVPPSLREAIMCFILSSSVRLLRENGILFNSMLVHVVRFTNVQEIVKEEVQAELTKISNRLQNGDGERRPTIYEEFQCLWESDFIPTTAKTGKEYYLPDWNNVKKCLVKTALSIEVRAINGSALDALDYEQHKEVGLNIIAIGGDKLSRGLTLEGLSVSYFLRSSRMYDTLMQMGRWFGYKEKYLDLCRLYTTSELVSWFRHIAAATEELRLEFNHMVSIGATPKEYGLKVRAHPALLVTSAVKMKTGTKMSLSYAGDISETIIFDTRAPIIEKNLRAVNVLLDKMPQYVTGDRSGGYLWIDVDATMILDFLASYESHSEARRADTKLLSQYIRKQLDQKELISWSVLIASSGLKTAPDLSSVFNGHQVGGIKRAQFSEKQNNRYTIRRLVSPSDEMMDLSQEEKERALEETIRLWKESNRKDKSETPLISHLEMEFG